MEKYISTKEIYQHFKSVSDEVMEQGTVFVVLKHSKPAYKIVPLQEQNSKQEKYSVKDIDQFIFSSKNSEEKSMATNYKKFLYQA